MSTAKDDRDWDQQEQRREARARAGVMDLLGGFRASAGGIGKPSSPPGDQRIDISRPKTFR